MPQDSLMFISLPAIWDQIKKLQPNGLNQEHIYLLSEVHFEELSDASGFDLVKKNILLLDIVIFMFLKIEKTILENHFIRVFIKKAQKFKTIMLITFLPQLKIKFKNYIF